MGREVNAFSLCTFKCGHKSLPQRDMIYKILIRKARLLWLFMMDVFFLDWIQSTLN